MTQVKQFIERISEYLPISSAFRRVFLRGQHRLTQSDRNVLTVDESGVKFTLDSSAPHNQNIESQ